MSDRLRHAPRLALPVAALLFSAPAAVAGDLAFVPAQVANRVTVIDLATMQRLADIPVAGKPAGVAVAQQAGRAYVTSPEGRFVTMIDTAARAVVGRIEVGGGPLGIAVHAASLGAGVAGQAVVVNGCGPIGLMNVAVARHFGALGWRGRA